LRADYAGKKKRERLDLAILTPTGKKLLVDFTVVYTTSTAGYRALGDGAKRSTVAKVLIQSWAQDGGGPVQGDKAEDAVLRIAAVESTGLRGTGFNNLIRDVAHAAHKDSRSLQVAARHTLEQAVSVTLMTGLANMMREGTQTVRYRAEDEALLAAKKQKTDNQQIGGTGKKGGKGNKGVQASMPEHKPGSYSMRGEMEYDNDDDDDGEELGHAWTV
jgi:hypothetical protein